MTTQHARAIPIDHFLLILGHAPAKRQGHRQWYRSPFRQENTPSFVVSADGKAWFDHGEGVGGNIIDLVKRLAPCSDVSQALAYLDQLLGQQTRTNLTSITSATNQARLPAYTLLANDDLLIYASTNQYTPLAAYLVSRAIDPQRVVPYVRQLTFCPASDPAQHLHGIGLRNESGGFELRARIRGDYRKTCLGPKDISFFPATQPDRQQATLHIFEGAPDFYTFLTTHAHIDPQGENFLILNGTGMVAKALTFLQQRPFSLLMLWNHNDPPGRQTVEQFLTLPYRVGTMNHLYEGFIDYNAAHMAATASKQGSPPPRSSTLKQTPKLS